jgi:hypothetical protein
LLRLGTGRCRSFSDGAPTGVPLPYIEQSANDFW